MAIHVYFVSSYLLLFSHFFNFHSSFGIVQDDEFKNSAVICLNFR